MKNLTVRKKLFLGFGLLLLLLTIVSAVSILSLQAVSRTTAYVKDIAFRQAFYLIEMEGMLRQMMAQISASVDTGTNTGLDRAKEIKAELDKKWAEVDSVFENDEAVLTAFHDLREKVDANFRFGEELVRMTINQEWAEIAAATSRFSGSREGLFKLLTELKQNGVQQLDGSLNDIASRSRGAVNTTMVVTIIAAVTGIALTFLIGALIVRPLKKLMEGTAAIAAGDLTRSVTVTSEDEIGVLARGFNHMTESLRQMLKKVTATFESLSLASVNMSEAAQHISQGSTDTAQTVETAHSLAGGMRDTVTTIASNMDDFSRTTEEIESWILEMATSVSEAAANADSLATAVENTTSSIHEMSASITQVADHVQTLFELQTSASSSVQEIGSSIKEVEGMTRSSAELAHRVNSLTADSGVQAVTRALQSIQAIRDHVNHSTEIIHQLGTVSENIGKIMGVINEIADQTRLLSLNASILAAQSGEHGKGFSVVAEEIGELSKSTLRSTKEVADLITAARKGAETAMQSMKDSMQMTEDSVQLSQKMEQILRDINTASASSSDLSRQIARSSEEQARGASLVLDAIQKVTSMSENISKAATDQSSGIRQIVRATENMKEIAYVSRRATEEQSAAGKKIAKAMEDAVSRSKSILRSIEQNTNDQASLINSMGVIHQVARANLDAASQMTATVKNLARHAEILKEELGKFRF